MKKIVFNEMLSALKERCRETLREQGGAVPQRCCWSEHTIRYGGPLREEQVISISALVSYVAYAKGISEYRVERELSNRFCVPNPKCLPCEQYDQIVKYMVDQVPLSRC